MRAEKDLARTAAGAHPAEGRRGGGEDGRNRAAAAREAVESAEDAREIGRGEILEARVVGPQDAGAARGSEHSGRDGGEPPAVRTQVVVGFDEGHQGAHRGGG